MKIKYSTDADICIIELRPGELYDSIDLKEGVILHLDKTGAPHSGTFYKIVKQFYNGMPTWSRYRL